MRRRDLLLLSLSIAALYPITGLPQQQKWLMGVLGGGSPGPYAPFITALREGLRDNGYAEGQNLAIEYRWAEDRPERLSALAADLVSRKADLIVTLGPAPGRAAKQVTSNIPIVFNTGDPIGDGLVGSLARPGGNLTGVGILTVELMPKRLEFLSELVPSAKMLALLVNPSNPQTEGVVVDLQKAADARGLRLAVVRAGTENDIETAFTSAVEQHANALIVGADPLYNNRRDQVVALAARYTLPAIYEWREFAAAGGLMTYGASLMAIYRQLGIYAAKILKGANPSSSPQSSSW
jgi:putative tryptophan/tyrosine transport system substrate-binding protein